MRKGRIFQAGLLGSTAVGLAMLASPADAGNVTSGNDNVSLTLSGQVNRVSFFADDGVESGFFHADNENSSTRWRLVGKARVNEDFSIGTLIEQDIQDNTSSGVSLQNLRGGDTETFDNRHMTFYLDSKTFGRLWIGRGNTSSNNIVQIDLSGTSVVRYSGVCDIGGSLSFRVEGTGAVGPSFGACSVGSGGSSTSGGVYSQHDGLSRRQRIRYDTPKIQGFQVSASHSEGDTGDVTVTYTADYQPAGIKFAAGVGYWAFGNISSASENGVGGSASLLHNSGLNLTFAASSLDRESTATDASTGAQLDDAVNYYIKVGYQFKASQLGKTALSVDYGQTDDQALNGDEATTIGVAVVQKIDAAATELFAFWSQYDLDRSGTSFEEINLAGIGGRVKF